MSEPTQISFSQVFKSPNEEPLVPPIKHLHKAECHWVEQIDLDGRTMGLDVWRWQPGIRQWCRPNAYGTGEGVDLKGYRWVSVCPAPLFEQENQDIKNLFHKYNNLRKDDCVPISVSDYEMLRSYFYEQIIERKEVN